MQKRRGKRKHTHTHQYTWPGSGKPEGQEKRKAEADGNGPRPGERKEDGSAKTNLPKRNLSLAGNAQDPNLLYLGKEAAHEIEDQWGLVDGTGKQRNFHARDSVLDYFKVPTCALKGVPGRSARRLKRLSILHDLSAQF